MGIPSHLRCDQAVEQVSDYLERVLSPEQAARLEQHLLICSSCDEYVAQMRALVGTLPKLASGEGEPDEDVLSRLLAGFDEASKPKGEEPP